MQFGSRIGSKVLGSQETPTNQAFLRAQLAASIQTRIGYNLRNFPNYDPAQLPPPAPTSYGRLDAVDAIVNEVYHLAIKDPDPNNPTEESKPANAPVSYPCLWDTPQHDSVEWLGIAQSGGPFDIFSLGRNVGEVIGVFGEVRIPDHPSLLSLGDASSVRMNGLRELEDLIKTLWSPQWPDDFPSIDLDAAREGAALYQQHCVSCHAIIERTDPNRTVHAFMGDANTDRQAAVNFFTRTGSSGKLAGVDITFVPFSAKMPATATANQMLTNVVVGTIVGGVKHAPLEELRAYPRTELHGR